MRFYSAVQIEPEKYLQEIYENLFLAFSTDFMYYLATLHDIDWRPFKIGAVRNFYSPHPLSPCTKNVKKAMQYNFAQSKLCYDELYDELVPYEADNKLELFIFRINNSLINLVEDPLSTFFTLLHVGRWTIQFYKYGTKDAAYLAPHLISHALENIVEESEISAWLKRFDMIAQDLIEHYKNGNSIEFHEEYFPYYEDLEFDEDEFDEGEFDEEEFFESKFYEGEFDEDEFDEGEYDESEYDEDEFDESKICVCGHCDEHCYDHFENADIYDETRSNYTESEENLEDVENQENQDDY